MRRDAVTTSLVPGKVVAVEQQDGHPGIGGESAKGCRRTRRSGADDDQVPHAAPSIASTSNRFRLPLWQARINLSATLTGVPR